MNAWVKTSEDVYFDSRAAGADDRSWIAGSVAELEAELFVICSMLVYLLCPEERARFEA